MIILVPFVTGRLDERTQEALDAHVPGNVEVRYREIDPHQPTMYSRILVEAWTWPGDLFIIEQDIEIHAGAVRILQECSQPWCGFPYAIGQQSIVCLGCTRFSAHLKATQPGLIAAAAAVGADDDGGGVPAGAWERMDVRIGAKLEALGHNRHVHQPAVTHHHFYPRPIGG